MNPVMVMYYCEHAFLKMLLFIEHDINLAE